MSDISRDTFDPANHFSQVVLQQGRVLLDADWNEQHAILLHYMRALAKDVFGPHAAPDADPGFEIFASADPEWPRRLAGMVSADTRYLSIMDTKLQKTDLVIGAGRYYVDGILVENEKPLRYRDQVGYAFDDLSVEKILGGTFLIYLDVWERPITYVQDDDIREKALGGPDTCNRTKVCWRVRALEKPRDPKIEFGCTYLETLVQSGAGALRARARQVSAATGPCVISPDARYRGPENQLYRVEIHRPGEATGNIEGATFKWARDNGSAIFPIRSFAGNTVEVETMGRDRRFGLKSGDWVEVVNDLNDIRSVAGPLFEVDKACGDSLTVTLKSRPNTDVSSELSRREIADLTLHPFLRRWDHVGDDNYEGALPVKPAVTDAKPVDDDWIELEDGVQIWFSKRGSYQTGDHWLIPARVTSGDVEWPQELDGAGKPVVAAAQPPRRCVHHHAPLLMIGEKRPGAGPTSDCRCRIKRLLCVNEAPPAPAPMEPLAPAPAPMETPAPAGTS